MLRVIVVDKYLNEIRVLETNFPEARILICNFHTIKYLKEMRQKPEFGKFSSDDDSQVDAAVHKVRIRGRAPIPEKIVNAEWVGRLLRVLRAKLEYLQGSLNVVLACKAPRTSRILRLIDSRVFFGKLKESEDGSMSMANCVKVFLEYDRQTHAERILVPISRIGQFVNSSYDDEMSMVLNFTTHFVAKQIEHKYIQLR
ncbi:Cysteine protease [Phytophthora megakarya]|uniref:Cysteine protease n=1 Tax=Phytophthora megakarya TaxID=4795 RepID=A0A225WHN9_9STRA|nr:Cysteine protease [Phytophthora megakarya]